MITSSPSAVKQGSANCIKADRISLNLDEEDLPGGDRGYVDGHTSRSSHGWSVSCFIRRS
jgi:hypothetical protein